MTELKKQKVSVCANGRYVDRTCTVSSIIYYPSGVVKGVANISKSQVSVSRQPNGSWVVLGRNA